jgi:chemotaxis signal transduction protein
VLRVERTGAVARIPGGPRGVAGVANLHGLPLPLVDLPALLAVPGAAAEARRWSVVLGRRGPELAVAADALELVDVPREALAPSGPRLGVTADGRVVLAAEALLEPSPPPGGDAR